MIIIRTVAQCIRVLLVFPVVFTSKCEILDLSIAVSSQCSWRGLRWSSNLWLSYFCQSLFQRQPLLRFVVIARWSCQRGL